jgi:hypothetical protein
LLLIVGSNSVVLRRKLQRRRRTDARDLGPAVLVD